MKTYIEQITRPLSRFNCVDNDVHVSIFEGLSLINYVKARRFVCYERHDQPCVLCSAMLEVAPKIIEEGCMKLKTAFEIVSPNVTYTALHARRKLLQMPLAALGIGERSQGNYSIFLVEKNSSVHYNVFKSLLNKWVSCKQKEKPVLSKETVNKLLKLAESDGEKQRLKFAIVGASGLSSTKAKSIYGFDDMTSKTKMVKDALEEATAIREAIENIAKSALLNSFGIFDTESSESSDNSETDSEQEDLDETGVNVDSSEDREFFNDDQLLTILYQCEFNWLEFVRVICERQKNLCLNFVESMLNTFAARLPEFNLKECELFVIEQSRQVYNLAQQIKEKEDIDDGIILSESDCEDPHELSTIKTSRRQSKRNIEKKKSFYKTQGYSEY